MYELYFDKAKSEIRIKKVNKTSLAIREDQLSIFYGDSPVRYNSNYFTCGNRQPLVEIAVKLKRDWLSEAKKNYEKIEIIEFKF